MEAENKTNKAGPEAGLYRRLDEAGSDDKLLSERRTVVDDGVWAHETDEDGKRDNIPRSK